MYYKKCNHVKFGLYLNIDLTWHEGIKNTLIKNEKFCILKLIDIDPTFTYFCSSFKCYKWKLLTLSCSYYNYLRQILLLTANKVNHSGYKRDWTTSDCFQLLI